MNTMTDYKTLSWNVVFGTTLPGHAEQEMVGIECETARRILKSLESHAQGQALLTRAQAVPFQDFPSTSRTETLRLDLWTVTGAAQWIGARNATSHNSLLWQFALLRLSERLNTGQWNDEPVDIAFFPSEPITHQEK
jgi:hypothetical protein